MEKGPLNSAWAESLTRWYHRLSLVAATSSAHLGPGAVTLRSFEPEPDRLSKLQVSYLSRNGVAEFLFDSVVQPAGNDLKQAIRFSAAVLDAVDYADGVDSICVLVLSDDGAPPIQLFRIQRPDVGPTALSGYCMILN